MGLKYQIVSNPFTQNALAVHPDLISQLGIPDQDRIMLRFGIQEVALDFRIDAEIDRSEIQISHQILMSLNLPMAPLYELRYQDQGIRIGPYIAILVSSTQAKLEPYVESLGSYVHNYDQIGGAILAFSLDSVFLTEAKISGFLYNPQTNRWDKGIYGYPDAMFSILELSMTSKWDQFQTVTDHFHTVLENRLFNHPVFNKWEMHQWLQNYPKLKKHLPETTLYRNPDDIYNMLKKHKRVYIKPILGRLGLGIVEATLDSGKIGFKYRINGQNRQFVFQNLREFHSYCKRNLSAKSHLIQMAIDLLSTEGRIVDFRLILVKDEQGHWAEMGLFGRYGAKNSIVSNITGGGRAKWGLRTLQKLLELSKDEALEWNMKMSHLAVNASTAMEQYGIHCGNLGLDLAIDTRKRLWILEINNQNPDHYIALLAGQENIFLQARLTNMLYCKKLAGFGESRI